MFKKMIFINILVFFIGGCVSNNDSLHFKKYQIDKNDLIAKRVAIDTIESFVSNGLYLVNIVDYGFLGNFSTHLAIMKKINQTDEIIYRAQSNRGEENTVSKDYIARVKYSDKENYGWFFKNDEKFVDELPKVDKIIDSLKKSNDKNIFITERNGIFLFFIEGRKVKSLSYGNIVTKDRTLNFDSLDYKLYKLVGDSLKIISNNGNDLLKQKEGIYFVPTPGYAVISKFNKHQVLSAIDSVSKLSSPPSTLDFRSH